MRAMKKPKAAPRPWRNVGDAIIIPDDDVRFPARAYPTPRPAPRPSRARAAVARVAPQRTPIDGKQIAGLASAAAGGAVASALSYSFSDNLDPKALGALLTAAGAAGTLGLADHWGRASTGVMAAGMHQIVNSFMAERAAAKADREAARVRQLEQAVVAQAIKASELAQASKPPALPPPPASAPRNAWPTEVYAAVDRAADEIDSELSARNGWEAAGPDPMAPAYWYPGGVYAVA